MRRDGAAAGSRATPSPGPLPRPGIPRVAVTIVAATAVVLGVVLVAIAWPPGQAPGPAILELADPDTGEVLYERSVAQGAEVVLTHTHSVTRRPVVERFSVNPDLVLTLESMEFDEPGPNLPTGPERFGEQMTTFTTVDGVYRVDHHGYPIGSVTLRTGGAEVDHTLTIGDDEQVRLLELTRAGGPVELRVTAGER